MEMTKISRHDFAHTDFLLLETDLLAADCTTPREKAVENAAKTKQNKYNKD